MELCILMYGLQLSVLFTYPNTFYNFLRPQGFGQTVLWCHVLGPTIQTYGF